MIKTLDNGLVQMTTPEGHVIQGISKQQCIDTYCLAMIENVRGDSFNPVAIDSSQGEPSYSIKLVKDQL